MNKVQKWLYEIIFDGRVVDCVRARDLETATAMMNHVWEKPAQNRANASERDVTLACRLHLPNMVARPTAAEVAAYGQPE